MGWEAWFVLAVVGLVLFGLVRNLGPPDVLLLGGSVLTGLIGIISPSDVLAGFTNHGVLTVAALFVVAAALRETGVLDAIGARLLGAARSEKGAILRLASPVVAMSAFLNNTPVVAMLMPVITDWCRKQRISPSRLLIPLSYLAILGGTCTLIGTSTNLVVNDIMKERSRALQTEADQAERQGDLARAELARQHSEELDQLGLFELGRLGLPYAIIGVLYLLLIGRKMLPDRKDLLERLDESPREYLVDMMIQPGCPLIGQRVEKAGLRRLTGLFLIEIRRDEQLISPVGPDEILREDDRLTFSGVVSNIVDLERIPGFVPAADDSYVSSEVDRRRRRMCEAVISPTSPLIGRSIRDANFRALYNAAVVAVHRGGSRLYGRIGDIVLRAGDTLLLQTTPHFSQAHRNNPDFVLVSRVEDFRPVRHERALISVGLLAVLVLLMALGTAGVIAVPIVLSAFLVAGLMVATRCISASDARQSIDLQTLLTIIAAFGMGKAIEKSGLAEGLANPVFAVIHELGPYGTLAAVYLITMVFTELITNNAAAVLVFPFAMVLAEKSGLSLRPFAMAVAFAASASFVTPIGYQTNMMVYGPGGYRFTDFVRAGLPLSLMMCAVATLLIPAIWPF